MKHETRVAYGEALAELAKENKDIIALDADLSKSTKTAEIKKVASERHINCGIAEADMMGIAAGLAASGKIPFASSFAVFAAGRAFEIIRNSICYPKLNVKICATHAGLSVGEDGATHQAIEDIALMRSLPNMKVFVASDYHETKALIRHVSEIKGPCYVRMQRGKSEDIYDEDTVFDFYKPKELKKGKDIALIATGLMTQYALKAADILAKEGIDASVYEVVCLKPLADKEIRDIIKSHRINFTIEEHSIIGGLYGAVAEAAIAEPSNPVYPIGVKDTFGESGKAEEVLKKYGLDEEGIIKAIKERI